MKLSSVIKTALSRRDMLTHTYRMAGELSQQCGKGRMHIFLDMLRCAARYGAGPFDYKMFRFYDLDDKERATYLTRVSSAAFVKRVNDRSQAILFDDKNLFYQNFGDLMGRETIDLRVCTREEFLHFLDGKDAIMAKPADAMSGHGIEKLYVRDFDSPAALWDYLRREDKPFGIAEEVLRQHPQMAALHPDSVNCVRIATFVKDDGTPTILYAACKAGSGGSPCDNTGRGGVTCRLDIDRGVIISHGHTEEGDEFVAHPTTGITLRGYEIPMAEACRRLALTAALRYPNFRYVGWDICITPTGPVLIEGNDYPGYDLAQMPDTDAPYPKEGLLPCFTRLGIRV